MNVREVHEFLNGMWESIFRLNEELKAELPEKGFKVEDVEEVFGAYIFLDGEWRLMKYPHPAFEIKPQIEVGATPEAYYFVVAVPKERISENFVGLFVELFPRSFIYGAEDFLSDVYNWRRDGRISPSEIMARIEKSDEKIFQFEANFESVETLREGIERLIDIGKRFEIFNL
ncbi:DUF3201 domain-containing protein [Thermococcus sp. GR7]|uniref:DUF3201 domain-containing protein n=1 Tax=unclassified Thermococcus TaxID=2627626 RepID=UPI00143135CD|nr:MULTISPECIES: DUF3201 domain-containing protein [unclassified Thermococcus]NJE46155.1 DUF3201 domain-containing protein [Thermococcus sp. GR7]NJE78209.1 DUF3201 domain-containing protein [Thermococcus sp. GR4]NJF22352.1 DUF3201 domain-containing protein [Thermococcus sp. GR5]